MFNANTDYFFGNSWLIRVINKLKKENRFNFLIFLTTIFLGSLFLTLSAKVKVPLYPIPMTLQPLAVLMISMLFGRNLAITTVGFYIFQGLLGLPVFAFGGGLAYIFGPTGGFILGFFIAAFVVGELADRGWGEKYITSLLCMFLGYLIIYLFGLCYFTFLLGFEIMFEKAVYPFMLKDFYTFLFGGFLIPQIWKLAK